ncbi:hypothetical protein [Vibrio owensii]|uniref:Uncharacterized protein n=1 Tax=Vibrio owensii CAIM 1854 = LMG 25443 TaxID=1229493 RepID=A0A0C1Z359_9VIBR|nr:hypothetical protein [Vibrio owensii]KIF50614.1 hypothetical protein H735_23950 [Vibrio owensii CAIM 1854 = LMG 25443]
MANTIINNKFDPSKRVFLKYSSLSAITVAASTVFVPNQVFAAVNNTSLSSKSLTLEELENINFYTKETSALAFAGYPSQTFEQAIDEVQYIANVMLNESIKHVFCQNHSGIASEMGDAIWPKEAIINMADNNDSVWQIISRHRVYLEEIMPEYIAQMIQSSFQDEAKLSQISRDERHQLNSWDMYGILKNIAEEEESQKFHNLMADFYNIAVDFATDSGASKLAQYKLSNPTSWAVDLYKSVLEDVRVEARMDSMLIENDLYEENQHNTLSLVSAMKILNSQGSGGLSDESIKRFEDTLYNTFVLATSLSTKWGSRSDEYSAVNNQHVINETLELLKNDSNADIQEFWRQFFNENDESEFISVLTNMDSETSIYSEDSVRKISNIYPMFNDPVSEFATSDKIQTRQSFVNHSLRGSNPIIRFTQSRLTKMITVSGGRTNAPSAILNMLLFIVGTSHYAWATTGSDEEQMGFADKLGIGISMFETTASLGYYAAVKAISKYMTKKLPSEIAKGAMYFQRYANFWLGMKNTNKVISRFTTKIADAIFSNSAVGKFLAKASLVLSVVSLGFGIAALVEAGYSGDTADIVFETLNVVVSTVGVIAGVGALVGASFAGPLGIAVLAVGAVIMIARWIYDLTRPVYVATPIKDFTNTVVEPNGYIFDEKGKFISVVKDERGFSYLQNTSLKTLELTSEDNATFELDQSISNSRAVAVSHSNERYGVVYSFERYLNKDNAKACYQDYNLVSSNGFVQELDWDGSADRDITSVIAVVESADRFSNTAALFLCKLRSGSTAVYMTDGLDSMPTYKVSGFDADDGDLQDVVAINGQNDIALLIATKKNLYRVNRNYTVTKINSRALTEDQSIIHSVELLAAGDIAHLLLRYNQQDDLTLRQAQLYTVSRSSDWSDYDTIRESAFFELNTGDRVLSRAAIYDSTLCNDFLVVGVNSYRRMKATLDEAGAKIIGFGNGIELPTIYPIDEAILLKNTYFGTAI